MTVMYCWRGEGEVPAVTPTFLPLNQPFTVQMTENEFPLGITLISNLNNLK